MYTHLLKGSVFIPGVSNVHAPIKGKYLYSRGCPMYTHLLKRSVFIPMYIHLLKGTVQC